MHKIFSFSHHAKLLIHNERKEVSNSLWGELQKDSPFHTFFDVTVLDIDTTRSIKLWGLTPSDNKKTALISFHTITIPAQNALLKLVEEPPLGVEFIFVTSNKEAMLPTLLSRLSEYKDDDRNETLQNGDVFTFLETSEGLRMKLPFIQNLLTREDESGRKDRESVRSFILAVATALGSVKVPKKYTLETLRIASFASLPSSSTKALLEYLSLLLPKTK